MTKTKSELAVEINTVSEGSCDTEDWCNDA